MAPTGRSRRLSRGQRGHSCKAARGVTAPRRYAILSATENPPWLAERAGGLLRGFVCAAYSRTAGVACQGAWCGASGDADEVQIALRMVVGAFVVRKLS